MKNTSLFIYTFLIFVFSIWTYSLTDRNLVLFQWSPYLQFQNVMWSIPVTTVTTAYSALILLLFSTYFLILHQSRKDKEASQPWILVCLIFGISVFAYNALSHDIFNYIFNAKMVIQYSANPHIQTALDFVSDPWIRFMHNVHTPAPYFYGWTALSLIPYVFGFGKFLSTWLLFKAWSLLGLTALVYIQWKFLEIFTQDKKTRIKNWLMFALNPLVIIETIMVGHNDAWMMTFALGGLYVLMNKKYKQSIPLMFISFTFLLISISMKYVTVVLLPVWMVLVFSQQEYDFKKHLQGNAQKFIDVVTKNVMEYSSILLLLPLLTSRSQWFHPWYLIWSLTFLPFIKWKWLQALLISLSFSSMLRYIPWMWNGAFEYTSDIHFQQRMITWVIGLLGVLMWLGWRRTHSPTKIGR